MLIYLIGFLISLILTTIIIFVSFSEVEKTIWTYISIILFSIFWPVFLPINILSIFSSEARINKMEKEMRKNAN